MNATSIYESDFYAWLQHQTNALRDSIDDSPSLKPLLISAIDRAWMRARRDAEIEPGIKITFFPERCPWQED